MYQEFIVSSVDSKGPGRDRDRIGQNGLPEVATQLSPESHYCRIDLETWLQEYVSQVDVGFDYLPAQQDKKEGESYQEKPGCYVFG